MAKYAISDRRSQRYIWEDGPDSFKRGIKELPPETKQSVEEQLILLDQVSGQIEKIEKHIREVVRDTPMMQLIKSLPGVGDILAIVIALEIGDVERFASAEHLASYSGTVPRVSSSGGKTHYGQVRPDVNHYLKWAYIEAANCIALQQDRNDWQTCGRITEEDPKAERLSQSCRGSGPAFGRSYLLYAET